MFEWQQQCSQSGFFLSSPFSASHSQIWWSGDFDTVTSPAIPYSMCRSLLAVHDFAWEKRNVSWFDFRYTIKNNFGQFCHQGFSWNIIVENPFEIISPVLLAWSPKMRYWLSLMRLVEHSVKHFSILVESLVFMWYFQWVVVDSPSTRP